MDNLKREKIAEGAHFNSVTDPRYKFNRITVGFFMPLDEDRASLYALVPRLLHRTNRDYPEARDFNNFLASLYNAKADFEVAALGDAQFLGVSLSYMDDSYALHGEKITEAAAKTVFDCVFNPALEDGEFAVSSVELGKREQTEEIEAEINDKRLYAANQAKRIIFEGEPACVNPLGVVGKTREITPEALFEAYKELMRSAVVEIVCVGCNDFADALNIAREKFSAPLLLRKDIVECESAYSPLKRETAEKTERLALNQSKMVLGFKTDCENRAALSMMSELYGGTISSKLFLNVRERLSLCYYCWSQVNRDKGVMYVSCGVEEENIEKAKAEILAQLENVKNGDFTDEEMTYALLSKQNKTKTVPDSPGSLTWWYISRIYQREINPPEEYLKIFDGVSREDIIEAARSMKPDTFYVLSGIPEAGQEEK